MPVLSPNSKQWVTAPTNHTGSPKASGIKQRSPHTKRVAQLTIHGSKFQGPRFLEQMTANDSRKLHFHHLALQEISDQKMPGRGSQESSSMWPLLNPMPPEATPWRAGHQNMWLHPASQPQAPIPWWGLFPWYGSL